MQKPKSRYFAPKGGNPSKVVQSASRGGDVIERLRQEHAGLRPSNPPQFLDMSGYDPDSFIEAMNMVTDVRRRFSALPSRLRAECQNDPRQLLRLQQAAANGDDVSIAVLKRFGLTMEPTEAPPATPNPLQTDLVDQAEGDAS